MVKNILRLIWFLPHFAYIYVYSIFYYYLEKLKPKKFNKDTGAKFVRFMTTTIRRAFNYSVVVNDKHKILEKNFNKNQYIIMSNHQSYGDAFETHYIFSKISHIKYVSKLSVSKNFWFKFVVLICQPFFVDRGSVMQRAHLFREIVKFLKEKKENLFIFPEGTRSHSNEMGEFVDNVFKMARAGGADILPVTVVDSFQNLDIKRKKKNTTHYFIHKPIPYTEYSSLDVKKLKEKIQQIILKPLKKKIKN